MRYKSRLFVAVGFSIVIAEKQTIITAFSRHQQQPSKEQSHDIKSRPFVLDSLANVARNGAYWSNHITNAEEGTKRKRPTNLKQTSSMYVSQLYKRIQKSHQDDKLNIDSMDRSSEEEGTSIEDASYSRRMSHWPEHFFEEILAYIAGGAAATSAFSAVIAGTIFATAVITVGALASAFFFGNEDDSEYYYLDHDELYVREYKDDTRTELESKDCDLDDAFFDDKSSGSEIDQETFDETTLYELQKCFAGKPSANVMFFSEPSSLNTCNRLLPQYDLSGFGIENDIPDHEGHSDVEITRQDQPAQHGEEQPKLVELIWHDSYSTAASNYYTTKLNARRQNRNKSNRKIVISSDQSFDLEDTEREGAILLSDTFRVTSSAFGLLADAVRFAGETTAATAGGTARLVGGAVKAGGWAVGSLGSAITPDTVDGSNNLDNTSRMKKHRTRTRHVAGASVKLLGDAIDNVAESLLLAGSATERIAFAAAGVAEGAVRVVEDFTSSLSNAFAKEGRRGIIVSKPSMTVVESSDVAADIITKPPETDTILPLEKNTDSIVESKELRSAGDAVEEDLIENLSKYLLLASTWTLQNADYIMQDTAGVASSAPQVLFVLVFLYFASLALLSTGINERSNQLGNEIDAPRKLMPDPVKSSNRKVIPEGILAGDGDTHSTLTIDSTMRRDPGTHFTQIGTGAVKCAFLVAIFPLKLFWVAGKYGIRLVLSKKTALLVIYALGWFFICQISQNKSAAIERKAMLAGYKNAVESAGMNMDNAPLESAFWLNAIITRVWRVGSDEDTVGGLEPLLASSVASILARRLEEAYSKPTGVTHVSLASLTFGKAVRTHVLICID